MSYNLIISYNYLLIIAKITYLLINKKAFIQFF